MNNINWARKLEEAGTIVIPGGDAVMLPLDIPPLQSACCHLLLPAWPARVLAPIFHAQPRLRARLPSTAHRARWGWEKADAGEPPGAGGAIGVGARRSRARGPRADPR